MISCCFFLLGHFMNVASSDIRLLLIDGYSAHGRRAFEEHGLVLPWIRYRDVLRAVSPVACSVDVVHPADVGASLPEGAEAGAYDGFVITGSSLHAAEASSPQVGPQLALVRMLMDAGVSGFGSCWGLQVAAQALGGEVIRNFRGHEAPIARKVQLTKEGRGHPMYHRKKAVFDACAVHDDIVAALPPGSKLLATNDMTLVQAAWIPYGKAEFWGVQYHPEMDIAYTADIMDLRKEKLVELGIYDSVATVQKT